MLDESKIMFEGQLHRYEAVQYQLRKDITSVIIFHCY